jgi:hypothetical protein
LPGVTSISPGGDDQWIGEEGAAQIVNGQLDRYGYNSESEEDKPEGLICKYG